MFSANERLFLLGVIYRECIKAGGDPAKIGPALVEAHKSGNWQAFIAMLIADLPQILAFITAIIPLFAGG